MRDKKGNIITDTTELPKISPFKKVMDASLRAIMGIRNVSISYTKTNGILFPGFDPTPVAVGNEWSSNAPDFHL